MAPLNQDRRLIAVTTTLGKDVFLLTGFSGQEEMSRPFRYQLDLLSENLAVAAKDIVGKAVTWEVRVKDSPPRYFSGVVSRFTAGAATEEALRTCQAEVVPWLWLLSRTADCRIFQNKSVPEIVEQIFKDLGFKDYELNLKGSYVKWEYCVQYRETDLNFVSRLLEQEGIFYYFRHEKNKHTLVLGDSPDAYKDCREKEVEFYAGSQPSANVVSWEHDYELRPSKWAQTDYNFETPSTDLMSTAPGVIKLPGTDKFEVYDYPGEYEKKADGDALTKVRMEADEAPYDVVRGASLCTSFTTGGKFTLKKHACPEEAGKAYAITSIQHSATESNYSTATIDQVYRNIFTCIPATVPFRPQRTSPKPIVQGPQPAVVVGPKGEEIYTDKYGRIRIQFFWDREGKKDEKSTCWVRVAQPIAGKRWGTSFWPRIGQEVLVTFLEGDPDRPLVTGCVYNAEQMPPYLGDGPDDKHPNDNKVSGYKSNSTKGGKGFNELRFDDNAGKEQVFIHAQRDLDLRVLNEGRERVISNLHEIIGGEKDGKKSGDRREMVYQDVHRSIKRHQVEKIEGNLKLTVGKGDAQGGGNVDISIEKKKNELVGADCYLHVQKGHYVTVDGDASLSVGGTRQESVTKDYGLEAKTVYIHAKQTLVIEAAQQLTLKVGSNFIVISTSGISIVGTPSVMINSGGAAGEGTPVQVMMFSDAQDASPTKPDEADTAKTGSKSAPG
jgi:type VI secretion system secreted protein VgrG